MTFFVMVVSGFVTYELFSEWKAAQAIYLWTPQEAAQALGLGAHEGWIKGIWTLLIVPSVLWMILGGLVVLLRGARNLGEAWRRLALPLVVLVSAGHMAKGLAKVSSWGGYLPMAMKEPHGTESATAIAAGAMDKPASWMSLMLVTVLSLLLLVALSSFSLRESRLADPETHWTRMPSILMAALASAFLIFGWGFLG